MRLTMGAMLLSLIPMFPNSVDADGLIYRLPEEGTSVEYEMAVSFERNGQTQNFGGSMTISSVGKETVNQQACRWIEFKMLMKQEANDPNEREIRVKVLVPESELAKGKSPIAHVKKAWFKPGQADVRELTDFSGNDAGPLPAFLAGPFADNQELDAETVQSGLGKLECKGATGSVEFEQNGETQKYTFTNRLNDKAPFGIVASEIKVEISRDGEVSGTGSIKLVAKSVKTGAVSEISNGL